MSIFSQKKPETAKKDDRFQSEVSAPKQEARPIPLEISPYNNELLLRGRIGVSAGMSAPKKEKEEKKETQPEDLDVQHDIIETEYAQVMKININNKFEQNME